MPHAFPDYKPMRVIDLVPYSRNARTHSEAQVAQIAASIREFGFTNPVLIDGDSGAIAGHGRLLFTTLRVHEVTCLMDARRNPQIQEVGWSAKPLWDEHLPCIFQRIVR